MIEYLKRGRIKIMLPKMKLIGVVKEFTLTDRITRKDYNMIYELLSLFKT